MVPRSVNRILLFPVDKTLSTANCIISADTNCPFLMLTVFSVFPAAINNSVCRHKNAGICITSTISFTFSQSLVSCTSVSIGIV